MKSIRFLLFCLMVIILTACTNNEGEKETERTYETPEAPVKSGQEESNIPTPTTIVSSPVATEIVPSVTSSLLVSNGDSGQPSLSDDGQRIVFLSYADNLVMDDMNGQADIFLFERDSNIISLITVSNDRQQFAVC